MLISTIETGFLKLDGGAMFGIVPKRLWQKLTPPDENNLCTWAMRCLLVETGDRKILIDTGMGHKQDEKFRSHFQPFGEKTLLSSLAEKGLQATDITDVFLTHLHFDHVGGAVQLDANGKFVPTFPNATYWSNEVHWNWAMQPNEREKASFLKENFVPLREAGVVQFINVQKEETEWLPGIRIRFVYGHTEAMMLPMIEMEGATFIYCADLLPSSYHLGAPYVMGYDVRPLVTLQEKEWLMSQGLQYGHTFLLEHDPLVAGITVKLDDRGRVIVDKGFASLDRSFAK